MRHDERGLVVEFQNSTPSKAYGSVGVLQQRQNYPSVLQSREHVLFLRYACFFGRQLYFVGCLGTGGLYGEDYESGSKLEVLISLFTTIV